MQGMKGRNSPMGKDVVHGVEEFPNFPWDRVIPEECGLSWGGITAGHDFNPRKPHISFCYEDGFVEDWEIPEQLSQLLMEERQRGVLKCQSKIQDALGL
jgi:hypothetical protein